MKKRMVTLGLALIMMLSLAVPAGAAVTDSRELALDESVIEMVDKLFNNKEAYVVLSADADVTEEFFAKHQKNYNNENYSIIVNEMLANNLCAISDTETNSNSRANITYRASVEIITPFTYRGTAYKAIGKATVTGEVNDSTGLFQYVNPAVVGVTNSGVTGATVSGNGYGVELVNGGVRALQFIKMVVRTSEKTTTRTWRAVSYPDGGGMTITPISIVES